MGRLSRYEKLVFMLTALFLGTCAGHFLLQRADSAPIQVTVTRQEEAVPDASGPGEDAWPDSLLPGERLSLNSASAADLTRLPQIGAARAQAIVDWREANGPFLRPEDVMEVKGIGPGIYEQIQAYLTVDITD